MDSVDSTSLPVVLLAAGRGKRLMPLTADLPKAMVAVDGEPLAVRAVAELKRAGCGPVVVVGGYRAEELKGLAAGIRGGPGVELRFNPKYEEADNVYSLWLARDVVAGGCLVVNADVLFEQEVARRLVRAEGTAVLCDDAEAPDAEAMKVVERDGRVVKLSKDVPVAESRGEYIGLARVDPHHGKRLAQILDELVDKERLHVYYEDALAALAGELPVRVASVGGLAWIEIDDLTDLERARGKVIERIKASSSHWDRLWDRKQGQGEAGE